MARYDIYSKGRLIGHSSLEAGDPPMGVAFGEFRPVASYALIQGECKSNHSDQAGLDLSVCTETGAPIECLGVSVLDYSDQGDPPYIEVNVIGVPYQTYAELFPQHIAAYDQLFDAPGAKQNDA